MTLVILLLLCALVLTLLAAIGKCPGWVPTFVLVVALLVERWGTR